MARLSVATGKFVAVRKRRAGSTGQTGEWKLAGLSLAGSPIGPLVVGRRDKVDNNPNPIPRKTLDQVPYFKVALRERYGVRLCLYSPEENPIIPSLNLQADDILR
jgi:hypothetical protein